MRTIRAAQQRDITWAGPPSPLCLCSHAVILHGAYVRDDVPMPMACVVRTCGCTAFRPA